MAEVEVVDETWIGLPPARIAPAVASPDNWRRWWPELTLVATEVRGEQGVRWDVSGESFRGTMELWLQHADGGTVVHFFLRVDGTRRPIPRRARRRLVDTHRRRAKRICWAVSDRLDPGRLARVSGPPTSIP